MVGFSNLPLGLAKELHKQQNTTPPCSASAASWMLPAEPPRRRVTTGARPPGHPHAQLPKKTSQHL